MEHHHQNSHQLLSLSQAQWQEECQGPCENSPNGRFRRYREEIDAPLHRRSYRAYDCQSGREVSWNVVAVARLPREVRRGVVSRLKLLRNLEHPNVMPCIDFWLINGGRQVVIISELVIKGSLKLHLNKICRPKLRIVKGWCRQLIAALQELHRFEEITTLPLIINPDTVVIEPNLNQLKVGLDAVLLPLLSPCSAGGITAPELAEGVFTPVADIFSFGMTLIYIATNKQPYGECKTPSQVCKQILENMTPLELEEIAHIELKNTIESCLRCYRTRPTLAELAALELWTQSDAALDKQPVPLVAESMTGSNIAHSKLRTKNSLGSTKSASVKETKKISETVQRQERQSEFVFNIQFEQRTYEVKAARPIGQQPPEQFQRFVQMLSHKFEDKEENNDNRTLFDNETNLLFKGSKTYKYLAQRQSQMEQTDFTCFNSEAVQNTRMAFCSMYEAYRMGLAEPVANIPSSEQITQQRLTIEKRELDRLHKLERQRTQVRKMNRLSLNQQTDIFNMEAYQGGFEQQDYWQRLQSSRNMNDELLNMNYSSILHIRQEPLCGLKQSELVELANNNEQIEANFIQYLTPKEDTGQGQEKSPKQVQQESDDPPTDELNKSFTEPAETD